jgi:hypothetical protein
MKYGPVTYRDDLYYINNKIDGKDYYRQEKVVSKWQFNLCKWLWKSLGRNYRCSKNVLREI